MFGDRRGQLDKLERLRDGGALTEEAFEARKRDLMARRPRPWALWISLCVLVGVLVAAGIVFVQRKDEAPAAAPAPMAAAPAAPAATAMPTRFTTDDLTQAFTSLYPAGSTVAESDGSRLKLTPKLLVAVTDQLVALVSEGVRDGGAEGSGGHATAGALRIDYLRWTGAAWAALVPPMRTSVDGNGFGEPPTWKVVAGSVPPSLSVETGFTGQGCTEIRTSVVRLLATGAAQGDVKSSEDCSAAGDDEAPATPDAPPAPPPT